jgi:hypothetical protein
MVAITLPDGTTERHAYNATGIRDAKTVAQPGSAVIASASTAVEKTPPVAGGRGPSFVAKPELREGGSVRYVLDGQNVLAELNASGATLAAWTLTGPGR